MAPINVSIFISYFCWDFFLYSNSALKTKYISINIPCIARTQKQIQNYHLKKTSRKITRMQNNHFDDFMRFTWHPEAVKKWPPIRSFRFRMGCYWWCATHRICKNSKTEKKQFSIVNCNDTTYNKKLSRNYEFFVELSCAARKTHWN